MRVRVLLGAAGSGKTSQCLEEVRSALLRSPEGPPLLFIAPKQATFQIERQLLADSRLMGYTRLFILSFERLAEFVLDALEMLPPRLLSENGRVMILRALLAQTGNANKLGVFRASSRLPGFAQEVSKVIRECQRAAVGPDRLKHVASKLPGEIDVLRNKLGDIALLFDGYNERLASEKLEDADRLLDVATDALRNPPTRPNSISTPLLCEGLWMDGFAEMTVQELNLLAAVLPWCGAATIAFCCEPEAVETALEPGQRRLSPWSLVADTASRCLLAISPVAEVRVSHLCRGLPPQQSQPVSIKRLNRNQAQLELFEFAPSQPHRVPPVAESGRIEPSTLRFAENPELAHLERHWSNPVPRQGKPRSIRIVTRPTIDQEVIFAAREICRHIAQSGRYREIAVLVRDMRGYQDVIQRVFARYGIPHFLDRREAVAHHPLAELTRYALRTVAFNWQQDDWFGALKSGLIADQEEDADWLENDAIARGWKGEKWFKPIDVPGDPLLSRKLEDIRRRAVGPMQDFHAVLAAVNLSPSGSELAASISALWSAFDVEQQLAAWTAEAPEKAVHTTVWQQMQEWLETVAMAFAHTRIGLREWLPIVEAGLASLTVGVIPPVLDEVLVGSIERSRNPELQVAFVMGVNEGVFPAAPPVPALLNEEDRSHLDGMLHLTPSPRLQLAHEQFYAYIAFTRARARLFVTCSETDRLGRQREPSMFIGRLQRLFTDLEIEEAETQPAVVHETELAVPLIRARWVGLESATPKPTDDFSALIAPFADLPGPFSAERPALSPRLVDLLYPSRLVTSVSRLEEYASCAFRFFVTVGLKAKERIKFEVDARLTGTFQHEVLMEFHHTLQNQNRRWREVAPADARLLVQQIAERRAAEFKEGVLLATPRDRVETENLIDALQTFIETAVGWAKQYEFDPVQVELQFNDKGPLPAWELALGGIRKLAFTGTIDRVDALIDRKQRYADLVVMDYKSSARQVDAKLLAAGIQMQLFAYLTALCRVPATRRLFDVDTVSPAGVFYVTLRGGDTSFTSRGAAFSEARNHGASRYRHRGRFASDLLEQFDTTASPGRSGEQFSFRLTNGGSINANSKDPLPRRELLALLDSVEQRLIQMGEEIFAGQIGLNPYRHGNVKACDRCDYRALCRIDHVTHTFRSL